MLIFCGQSKVVDNSQQQLLKFDDGMTASIYTYVEKLPKEKAGKMLELVETLIEEKIFEHSFAPNYFGAIRVMPFLDGNKISYNYSTESGGDECEAFKEIIKDVVEANPVIKKGSVEC
uniref:DUF4286 family protein n=1 Tax=Rhabditophanes sp. KR3021 TaxID=114890 RepID=A0AC35TTK1_9BILA